MKLLVETTSDLNFVQEVNEATKKKDLYIEGITLQSEVKNKNGRVYPKAILADAIKKHINEKLQNQQSAGELDHPKENSSQINPDRISHRFIEVREDGNNYITKALVLNTTCGKQVKNLMEGGFKLGISSRGFGDVKESNGAKIVQSLYLVSLGDIVTNPSAPNAFVNAVMESVEWVWENGILVGKDLSKDISEYQKAIDESTQSDRDAVAVSIMKDYFQKIK